MGVRSFYKNLKRYYPSVIESSFIDEYDILIVELNGIFYDCTKSYMLEKINQKEKNVDNSHLFHLICQEIISIVQKFPPKQTIFLVVDGFAPKMKLQTQIERRYKNTIINHLDRNFDYNVFTPGTQFLHNLTKYIDYFIKKSMNDYPFMKHLTVYFSNEKNRGEGEFKAKKFLETPFNQHKKTLVLSNDSDWITSSLLIDSEIVIARRMDDHYEYVNMLKWKEIIQKKIFFETENEKRSFVDIYLMFLLLGNDYIGEVEPWNDFQFLFRHGFTLYKKNKKHFVNESNQLIMEEFLKFIHSAQKIIPMFENKKKEICKEDVIHVSYYFLTIQNIIDMNVKSCFDWNFFHSLKNSSLLYSCTEKDMKGLRQELLRTEYAPVECLYHLFILLPYQSKSLLPKCLYNFSSKHYPSTIMFDLKCNKFSLPTESNQFFDFIEYYNHHKPDFTIEEKKRNTEGKLFRYDFNQNKNTFLKTCFGTIRRNRVESTMIEL